LGDRKTQQTINKCWVSTVVSTQPTRIPDEDKTLPQNTTTEQSEHIVILLMVGEGEKYRTLEQAVRRVFECPPYYFEVRSPSDYTYKPDRLENIREHINRAQGFIVEISELNPNIMFELGAVTLSERNRPIFPLRSQNATAEVIASFSNQIHITYSELNQSVEQLTSEIRHAFERDGRIVHEGINALLSHRQKRYLSCTLLKNLPRTRLNSDEISSLLKHYTTVEDLLAAEPTAVSRATGLQEYVISALRGGITDSQFQNHLSQQLPAKIEVIKQFGEEKRTEILDFNPVKISLTETNKTNLETFLEQSDITHLKALIALNAVGRIESPQNTGIGTGVLVAKNLLLTCNHIFNKTGVQQAWVRFGYKLGSNSAGDIFELDLNFVAYHNQLDYALIRLQSNPSVPPISPVNVILNSGQKIRLIHHPKGQPVVISGLGEIVQVGEDYIDHNLNTEEGSSGAPIFNDAWELVAIHRGNPGVGRPTQGTMEGKPISAFWNQITDRL